MNQPTSRREPGPFDDIASRLRESAETLAEDIAAEIFATIASYAAVEAASLRKSLLQHIDTAATSLQAGGVPDTVADVSVAAERARSGVPIEHVLLAIRLAFQRLREYVTAASAKLGIPPTLQLDGIRILWDVNDLVSRQYAVAHREEDLQMARTAATHRIDFFRKLMTEGVRTPDMNMRAGSFGLAPGQRYRAFCCEPGDGQSADSALRDVTRWATSRRVNAIGTVVDGDAVGVLADADVPPAGPTVGVGPSVDLHRLDESFRVASQLMQVTTEFGHHGPQTIESLCLHIAVANEHVVGDNLVERVLGPLLEQGPFGLELIASLDVFLDEEMNTAAAADRLVVHPNTLRYRINQVKELSVIDLRSARGISEAWWALRRYEWTKRTGYTA